MRNLDFSKKTYIGIVEDNSDPKHLGRVKAIVVDVYDDIPLEDIPWATPFKDVNGEVFNKPDVGKVVTIIFDGGDVHKPEYIFSEHYNINLEKKLKELSESDYDTMKTLLFNHKTQVYVNESEGLKLDHKFNVVNITEKTIDLNLKDNFSKVHIGTADAPQQAILGNHWMDWFDKFVDNLLGSQGGPYLGNLGAPVIPHPGMIQVLLEYKALRDPKFLSHHIYLTDNGYVKKLDRIAEGQKGDKWKSTVTKNDKTTKEPVKYKSKSGTGQETPEQQDSNTPNSTADGQTSGTQNPTSPNSTNASNNQNSSESQITPDTHQDAQVLIQLLTDKGYKLLTKSGEVNIIGIRYQYQGQPYSDAFKDKLFVLYKDDSNSWVVKYWRISTIPGLYMVRPRKGTGKVGDVLDKDGIKYKWEDGLTMKKWASSKRPKGVGIMVPAQYLNIYQMFEADSSASPGSMKGKPTMRSVGTQMAYRDKHFDDTKIYFDNLDNIDKGNHGMFIHRGFIGGQFVGSWSEGCQVFANESDMDSFFDICREHKKRHGNAFGYTLCTSVDYDEAKRKVTT